MQEIFDEISEIFKSALGDVGEQKSFSIDEYLDQRDEANFDAKWFNTYNLIEQEKKKFSSGERKKVDEWSERIREIVFKNVMKKFANSDLAGYISDDAGMIFEANFCKNTEVKSYAIKLYGFYKDGKFPVGDF